MAASGSPGRADWFRWWYFTIGAGFLLLAVRALLVEDLPWKVALRFIIGIGFVVLGIVMVRRNRRDSGNS